MKSQRQAPSEPVVKTTSSSRWWETTKYQSFTDPKDRYISRSYRCSLCGAKTTKKQWSIGSLGYCQECLAARRQQVKKSLKKEQAPSSQLLVADVSQQLGSRWS